jgi:hypothetical protein
MRGPCACPPREATLVPHIPLLNRLTHQDKHKAPAHPFIHSLSLQDGDRCITDLDCKCSLSWGIPYSQYTSISRL